MEWIHEKAGEKFMWIFTTTGFLSVVQKSDPELPEDPNVLCARGRRLGDLEELQDYIVESHGVTVPIQQSMVTDYEYRMYVSRDQFKSFVSHRINELDYNNYKSECQKKGWVGSALECLHEIWDSVYRNLGSYGSSPEKYEEYIEKLMSEDPNSYWNED